MQQEKNKISTVSFILSIISTTILTPILFVLLGSFYVALEHPIGLNIFVWILIDILSYLIFYVIFLIIKKSKKEKAPKFYNGWALLSGLLVITIICFFTSYNIDDYLYVEVMAAVSGLYAMFQIIYEVIIKRKK
jgi:amino acid transporter